MNKETHGNTGNQHAKKDTARTGHLNQRHLECDLEAWKSAAFDSEESFTGWVKTILNKEIENASN